MGTQGNQRTFILSLLKQHPRYIHVHNLKIRLPILNSILIADLEMIQIQHAIVIRRPFISGILIQHVEPAVPGYIQAANHLTTVNLMIFHLKMR